MFHLISQINLCRLNGIITKKIGYCFENTPRRLWFKSLLIYAKSLFNDGCWVSRFFFFEIELLYCFQINLNFFCIYFFYSVISVSFAICYFSLL